MQRAQDVAEYVADPFGRYFAGPTFLHFFLDPGLCGTLFWGRPDEPAVRTFTRVLEVELPERSPPHAAFVDTRRLTAVDAEAFQALVEYLGPRAEVFGRNVTRQALVRPAGVLGAVVAGFYEVTPAAYPERTRLFADAEEALCWLGRTDPAPLLAELDAAQAEASGTPAILRVLHDYVAAHPRRVSVREVARALGLSPRTLQHRLRCAGTSFRREVNAARVQAARRLLETSDAKLTSIALAVGCASLQHFSTLFRKHTGHAPSAWRARHARRGPL